MNAQKKAFTIEGCRQGYRIPCLQVPVHIRLMLQLLVGLDISRRTLLWDDAYIPSEYMET